MLAERTGPRWARSLTNGVVEFGDQRVTVPFAWPRCRMALLGFWVMAVVVPSLVGISVRAAPVEVSVYLR